MSEPTSRPTISKLKFFAREVCRRVRDELRADRPSGEVAPVFADDRAKSQYAKNVFSNGDLPSNFSITIGVAPCDYSCRFCPQSVSKPKKATWLDMDLLRKCLSEMPEEGIGLNISSFSETIAAPNRCAGHIVLPWMVRGFHSTAMSRCGT